MQERTSTHYAVLQVAEDATYAQIRCSYLSCLLSLHPDKQQHEEEEAAPLSSSPFLRLQEAWNVLRNPQSRLSYDRHLASTRLLLAPSIAEDVLLEEMSRDCEDAEAGAPSYVYPCRCGDFFAVSLQEIDELGLCGEPTELGSCKSIASKDHLEEQAYSSCLQDNDIRNQGFCRRLASKKSKKKAYLPFLQEQSTDNISTNSTTGLFFGCPYLKGKMPLKGY